MKKNIQIHCKYDELINPKKLKNHPKNRNGHGQDQIERLAELFEYHGVRHPIIVSTLSGCIVAGHGRKLAAIRAGLTEYPIVYQDFDSSEAEYAFLQADNAIALWAELDLSGINTDLPDLGPDFDIKMLGIKDFVLDPSELNDEPLGDPDEVPEEVETKAKLGDLFILGEHRLLCGDSTDMATVERLMNGKIADFRFCDPPYNLGFEYNSYNDNKSEIEYEDFSKKWFSNLQKVTNKQCITLGTKNISLMANLGKASGVGCWVKKNWITSCHIAKLQQWEPIFFYGDYTKFKRNSDLFEINRKYQNDVGENHTCPKQIELIDEIIIHYCENSVVDLFGGSGTTLISAEKNNKRSFLCELDPHYIDVIVQRWQNFTGKKAYLQNIDGSKTFYDDIKSSTKSIGKEYGI